jgi:hypothetical protein
MITLSFLILLAIIRGDIGPAVGAFALTKVLDEHVFIRSTTNETATLHHFGSDQATMVINCSDNHNYQQHRPRWRSPYYKRCNIQLGRFGCETTT